MDGTITDAQVHLWLQDIADSGYVSLHFDTPALGGLTAAEISGGGYQRFKMSWSNPDNRAIWSVVDARFTGLVQTKVTYFGVWDKLTKGMCPSLGRNGASTRVPAPPQNATREGAQPPSSPPPRSLG